MADRNQHLSRDDETRRAVFDQVDLQTAELEIVGSIYDGFAAAIVVTGQPRTVALTREYGDAVQLMALIERGRAPLFAIDLAGGRCLPRLSSSLRVLGRQTAQHSQALWMRQMPQRRRRKLAPKPARKRSRWLCRLMRVAA